MKRLLIDVNSIVPYFAIGKMNGIGRTTLELIQALSQIQNVPFDICLYSQNMKGIGGRNLRTRFSTKHLYFPHRPGYDQFLQKFRVRECFTNYDLMHIPHNFEFVSCPERTIVTLHDALFMRIQEKAFGHEEMKKTTPPFIRKCKAVITCSEYSKKDIVETMQLNPDKIAVIPWGIRHDLFYPEKDKEKLKFDITLKWGIEKPYFLSVSCNDERKNTPLLIDAYIRLLKNNPENDLRLVWNAPAYIRKRVEEAGAQDRIHFVENVSDDDLRKLYCGATVTIFPSLYEGFGLPVLESMACGTPVICSKLTSLPEVGGDAVIYIDPENVQEIENAMGQLENNEFDKSDYIDKGIRRASQYTWEKCAHKTLSVYEHYLNEIE